MTTDDAARPAGFWRRVAAALVDGLLLAALGWVLAIFCFDFFALLQGWGKLLGLCIAGVYFVPFNSVLGGGQTLGKRWLGIRVAGRDGQPISLGRSLLRYLLLAPPVFLNGIVLPGLAPDAPLWTLLSLGIFGLGGASLYLLIFNRRTRQLLHDFAAGSVVVPVAAAEPLREHCWRGHLVVCALLLLAAGLAPWKMRDLVAPGSLARLADLQRAIEAQRGVLYAAVAQGTRNHSGDPRAYGILDVVATVVPGAEQGEAGMHRVAEAVLGQYDLQGIDIIQITLRSGFDIGISAGWKSQANTQPPTKWRHDIDLAAAIAAPPPRNPAAGLVGSWRWTSGSGCVEQQVYSPDGSMAVVSGQENTANRYRVDAGGSGGYLPLVVETLTDDGGKDCADSTEVDVGKVSTVYVAFHPSGNAMALCQAMKPDSCWGVYRRIKAP